MDYERHKAIVALRGHPDALIDLLQERGRQDSKWGVQNNSDDRWNTILTEEVGEVAQASLDLNPEVRGTILDDRQRGSTTERGMLREELVQVAAVAVAWIEAIDRRP